jgi:hypothetical protein
MLPGRSFAGEEDLAQALGASLRVSYQLGGDLLGGSGEPVSNFGLDLGAGHGSTPPGLTKLGAVLGARIRFAAEAVLL